MLEAQKERFVRDFLKLSCFVAPMSTLSEGFLMNLKSCYFKIDVSCDVTKCQVCHGICTLSPFDAALTMRFAKDMQLDASEVLRLPRKMTMVVSNALRLPRKMQFIF